MPRLRRRQPAWSVRTIAAEVLEQRSLLSAGAGAVHSAVQHAHGSGSAPEPALQASTIHTVFAVSTLVTVAGQQAVVPGTMAVTFTGTQVGAHFTAHLTLNAAAGETAKGTIKGQVLTSGLVGGHTELTVSPGGKLVDRRPGHPTTVLLPSISATTVDFFPNSTTIKTVDAKFAGEGLLFDLLISTL
jgi:hypothetical protein